MQNGIHAKNCYIMALALAPILFFANCTDDLDYIDRPTKEDLEAASSSSGNAAGGSSTDSSSSSFEQKECVDTYNHDSHFCYDGEVYKKCGGIDYNPTTNYCENEVAKIAKCGETAYNPLTQVCKNSAVETKCGNNSYKPSTQFCANNEVYDKCEGKNYDISKQFCATDNKIYDKCGEDYNPVFGAIIIDGNHEEAEFCDTRDFRIYKIGRFHKNSAPPNTLIIMAENLRFAEEGSICRNGGVNPSTVCDTNGRYYQWNTARNACPAGWRLPSVSEVQGYNISFVGSGGYYNNNTQFTNDGHGYWWSNTSTNGSVPIFTNGGYNQPFSEDYYLNVRCVRD